jgi:hypothetical protein
VRDNVSTGSDGAGLAVSSVATGAKVYVVGSSFIDNVGANTIKLISVSAGAMTITNTVVWNRTSGTMTGKAAGATLTAINCLVKDQTLAGTGNLAGSVDPKLRSDVRLRTDSPLRGAGVSLPQSRIDMEGELRPSAAPDIGVDQFNDADIDGLPDAWEIATVSNMTSMWGAADDDNDQLSNTAEYDHDDPNGPKAPGKPGAAEGFIDPKNGENWVPNPNGKGYGWEHANGRVWVPTGQGPLAHGGPHWDEQDPRTGDSEDVYPGGRRR